MNSVRHSFSTFAIVLTTALVVIGCGQAFAQNSNANAKPAKSSAATKLPSPFSSGQPVNVFLVRHSDAGDYYQQWGQGAKAQARAIKNLKLHVMDARDSNARQANQMKRAISAAPAAIIIDHGFEATMEPLVRKAVKKGIIVAVFDLELKNSHGVVNTNQDDKKMAALVLNKMLKDVGKNAPVGYVNTTGYAALDRRAAVWHKFVKKYAWDVKFSTGKVTQSTATDNIPLVAAALTSHPNVKAIFAPYDELAKGTSAAVRQLGMTKKVKVYGMDISNADLQKMRAKGSPWVATAATDPAAVGAALVRLTALHIAGQSNLMSYHYPAVLLTQKELRNKNIINMADLIKKKPELTLKQIFTTDWLTASIQ